jgi:hypothetical protein
MVKIDDAFTQAILEEEDKYEGKEIDANVAACKLCASQTRRLRILCTDPRT